MKRKRIALFEGFEDRVRKGKRHLERGEGVGRDVEGGDLDVFEKVVKIFRVQQDLSQRFVPCALAQHRAAVQRDLLVLVPVNRQTEKKPTKHE